MRLSLQTQQIIKDTTQEVFGKAAHVKVFGSRINDDEFLEHNDILFKMLPCAACYQ